MASAIFDDDEFAAGGGLATTDLSLRKSVPNDLGSELYTIALAGHRALPEMRPVAVLTGVTELRQWFERMDDQKELLDRKDDLLSRLRAEVDQRQAELDLARREVHEASQLLLEAETRAARLEARLEQRVAQLQSEVDYCRDEVIALNEAIRVMHATRVWRVGSTYWRMRDRLLRRR
jgi:hypothetical protein